jgi:hypothetical protein
MKGISNPDGWVRLDFPGGWPGDKQNKFEASGRTTLENEAFAYVRTLANYRKNSSALKTGKLMQYVPDDGTYTYFRYDDKQTVMVVMNTGTGEKTIDPQRFSERIKGFSKAKNIVTSTVSALHNTWKIPGKTVWVLELAK